MNNEKTSDKIKNYIQGKSEASGHELANYIGITDRAIRKQLKNMVEDKILIKVGKPPKVFYKINKKDEISETFELDSSLLKFINKNYIFITPSGELKKGINGFIFWCVKNKLSILKTAQEYYITLSKYNSFKKGGFIDGMKKLQTTFKNIYLDKVFYLDFYSIERFGKTKLGQSLLYAKQSQDRKLITTLVKDIKPSVETLINKYKVDAVGFIPPTVKREVQFMRVLEAELNLSVRILKISKIKTEITVPQKTLNKLEDRVENAGHTIIVEDKGIYNNILLIDDAVGSGATLNETARQIKHKHLIKGKIIGLAITGSFKGFEVISEV